MEVKVYGNCRKCLAAYQAIEKAVEETGVSATLVKVDDIRQMLAEGVRTMPTILIDGQQWVKGYVPTRQQIEEMLCGK